MYCFSLAVGLTLNLKTTASTAESDINSDLRGTEQRGLR